MYSHWQAIETAGAFCRGILIIYRSNFFLLKIIIPAFLLVVFQIAQNRRSGIDGEGIAPVIAKGYHADAHFPAMQVAVDAYVGEREFFGNNIVMRIASYFPFRGDVDVAAEPYSMGI